MDCAGTGVRDWARATWARPRARLAFDKPVAGLFALASPPGHPATRTLHWACTWCLFLLHVGGPISLPTRFGPSNSSSKSVGRHRDQLGRRVLTTCYVAHGVLDEGGNPRGGSCKRQPRTSHAKYSPCAKRLKWTQLKPQLSRLNRYRILGEAEIRTAEGVAPGRAKTLQAPAQAKSQGSCKPPPEACHRADLRTGLLCS